MESFFKNAGEQLGLAGGSRVMETEMDWETAAAAEESSETNGGNVSNHDSSRGGPCANTRVGGRERWAARRKQMRKSGRMPQRKGTGAWRRRDKHSSGFSDGSGSDGNNTR